MQYIIEKPKTESGERYVPMSDEVVSCFKRILKDRVNPKVEPMVDGMTGFFSLIRMICLWWHYIGKKYFQHIREKYNSIYKVQMPPITPHVCRHTFCSNMAKSGMNPKMLQYIMGHSDISVTMNTYTHVKFQDAQEDFQKQLIHNDLMKMREKWLNASIYLNPQFLTCRFPMADLPLVQT